MSSDHRRLNFSGPRQSEEAGLDRFGSASLSRSLVPDLDFFPDPRLPGTNETDSFSHA